jgi:hypothetical protein
VSEPESASWQAFHGVNGELIGAHQDEDGVMIRADFHGSKLSASAARELARHLEACADMADDWMGAAVADSIDPREYGEQWPEWPRSTESEPEQEPEPEDYDPGPEVDDEGGMSEYRHFGSASETWL